MEAAQITRGQRANVSAIVLWVSLAIMLMAWLPVAGIGGDVVRALGQLSVTVRIYQASSGLVLGLGFLICAAVVLGSYLLISRNPPLFMGTWLVTFALGDADIGLFQHAALLFRYSMMLVLVVLGLGKVTQEIGRRRLDVLQVLALSYLAIQIVHLLVDGPSVEALLILPMQAAAGLGLVIGCRDLLSSERSLLRLGRVLAWVGVLLTLVALSALVLRTAPFLGGRFRGWHDLPTGFATAYVMFLVPLVWVVLGGAAAYSGCVLL